MAEHPSRKLAVILHADVAGGSTDIVDPTAWRIVDGKLYLFYGEGTAVRWEQRGISGEIAEADANWKTIKANLTQ